MTNSSKRLDYIDALRGFAILCVVAGHSTGLRDNAHRFISVFMLPVFFVISGFLMQYKNDTSNSLKGFLKKRFTGILVPYIGFSILILLYESIYGLLNAEFSAIRLWLGILQTIFLYGKSILWFLPALFISAFIFFLLKKYLKHPLTILITLILAAIATVLSVWLEGNMLIQLTEAVTENVILDGGVLNAPFWRSVFLLCPMYLAFTLERSFYMLPFLCFGWYLGFLLNKLDCRIRERQLSGANVLHYDAKERLIRKRILTIGISVSLLVGSYFLMQYQSNIVDIHNMNIGKIYLAIPVGILSTGAWMILFMNLPEIPLIYEFFVLCGRNSLVIMATHLDFGIMNNAKAFAMDRNQYTVHFKNYIFILHIYLIEAAYEIPICYIVNRFFPFLAGKGFRKSSKNIFKVVK